MLYVENVLLRVLCVHQLRMTQDMCRIWALEAGMVRAAAVGSCLPALTNHVLALPSYRPAGAPGRTAPRVSCLGSSLKPRDVEPNRHSTHVLGVVAPLKPLTVPGLIRPAMPPMRGARFATASTLWDV
jgi:hypothetical protein